MSTTIDQKVVSLQFDNKQFERETANTMSTLDKLKEKLHFKGASKGLEDIGNSAKKVDMRGLGGAVETVTAKFSAMQIMATTALANITNSAVNAGKRMAKALTIEPVTTGLKEYETQINATQTILANTQSQGTKLPDVNKALEELNKYADQTIYNFTEMTNNIGKFTAAGVDLQTSVDSIKGIANLAAVSGSTSQQASTAMYQLSQALAAGKVSLMDWNSVVNAGMGGKLFQDALIRTSELLKTGAKESIKTYGSFRESLTKGEWLTTEVLTETLKQLSGAYTEADLIAQGFTKEQAKEIKELADSAVSAATEVKTFTQLWDVLKESAQSGWSQTWKLIIGDFDQAKELLTPLADTLTGFINKMSDARNRLIEGALYFTKPWTSIMEKLGKADLGLGGITKITDKIGVAADKVKYFQDVVDKVWHGDFNNWGDNPDRRDLLKEAGYNPKVVQYLVNLGEEAHKAGKKYKLTSEDIIAAHKKYGVELETTAVETEKNVESTNNLADALKNLSDEDLKKIGLTEDEIVLLRDLQRESEASGDSIEKLAEKMSKTDGRTLLVDSFKNIGATLVSIFGSIGDAWREVFPPMSVVKLYNLIDAFNAFTNRIKTFVTDHAEELKDAFKGIFSLVKLITMIFGGAFRIAFTVVSTVAEKLGLTIGGLVLKVLSAITKFSEWVQSVLDIDSAIDFFIPIVVDLISVIVDLFKNLKDSGAIQAFVGWIKSAATAVKDWVVENVDFKAIFVAIGNVITKVAEKIWEFVKAIKESESFQKFIDFVKKAAAAVRDWFVENVDLVEIVEFLGDVILKAAKAVWNLIVAVKNSKAFQSFISFLKKAGGGVTDWLKGLKDAPSIGKYIIDGLLNGLKNGIPDIVGVIVDIASGLVKAFCDFLGIESPSKLFGSFGMYIILGLIAGVVGTKGKLLTTFKDIATGSLDAVEGSGIGATLVDMFVTPLKKIVEFVKTLDLGTLLVAGLGVGIVASLYKFASGFQKIGEALGSFGDMCDGISQAVKDVGKSMSLNFKAKAFKTLAIALAILVASVIAIVYVMDSKGIGTMWIAVGVITAITGVMVGMMVAINKLVKDLDAKTLAAAVGTFVGFAAAFLILGFALQACASVPADRLADTLILFGAIFVALSAMIGAIVFMSKMGLSENLLQAGIALVAMAASMWIMAKVLQMISGFEPGDVWPAVGVVVALSAVFAGLVLFSKYAGKDAKQAGTMILLMAAAFWIMTYVIKAIDEIKPKAIFKGLIVISALAGVFAGLTLFSQYSGSNASKAGVMILLMAGAFWLMTHVIKAIDELDDKTIDRGLGVIIKLGGMFAALMAFSKFAGNNAMKAGIMLLSVAGAMLILTLVIFLIGEMDPKKVAQGVIAIGFLSSFMGALMFLSKGISKNTTKPLITLIAAIVLLVAAMIALTFLDPAKVGVAAGALSAVIGVFALLAYVAKGLKKVKVKTIAPSLAALIVVTGLLAFFLTMMVRGMGDNADAALPAAIALGALVAVMVASMFVLSKIDKMAGKALKGAAMLALICVPLLAAAAAIAIVGTADNPIGAVQALIVLVGAMVLLLPILALVGMMGVAALYGIVFLGALIIGIVGLMVGLGALMESVPLLQQFMTTGIKVLIQMATGLGDMIAAFVTSVSAGGLLETLAVFAMLPLLLVGLIALIPLMVTVGALAVGIGALMAYFPTIQGFLDTGLPILLQLATAIGQMIAAFTTEVSAAGLQEVLAVFLMMPLLTIGLSLLLPLIVVIGALATAVGALLAEFPSIQGFIDQGIPLLIRLAGGLGEMIAAFVTGALSGLPEIGLLLSQFMINAMPFIMMSKLVDASVLAGAGIMVGAILAFAVADLITGITSFLPCCGGLTQLGADLSAFMANAKGFIDAVCAIPPGAMGSVVDIAEAILLLTAADLVQGIMSFFGGESSLESFANQLPFIGQGISGLLEALPGGTLTGDQVNSLKAVGDVVQTLAQVAKTLPNTGGLLGDLVGNNDIGPFAEQFPSIGIGIRDMLEALPDGTLTEDQINAVKAVADCVKTLAEVAGEIPNAGGLLAQALGDNNIGDFADQFPNVGTGITAMLNALPDKTLTEDQVNTVKAVADCVSTLAGVAGEIPNAGGLLAQALGDNTLGNFAEQFPNVGKGVTDMLEALPDGTLTSDQIDTVKAVAGVVSTLAAVANTIPNEGGWINKLIGDNRLEDFASQFPHLGKGIKDFSEAIVGTDVEAVTSATNAVRTIAYLATYFPEDLDRYTTFGGKLEDFGEYVTKYFKYAGEVTSDSITSSNNIIASLKSLSNGLDPSKMSTAAAAIERLMNAMKQVASFGKGSADGLVQSINTLAGANFADLGVKTVADVVKGMDGFSHQVKTKLKSILSDALLAVKGEQGYDGRFREFGEVLMTKLASGISDKLSTVQDKASFVLASTLANLRGTKNYVGKFETLGSDAIKGFARGMSKSQYLATDKGRAIAKAVEKAIRDELDINSPSKVMAEVGMGVPEGLALGIDKFSNLATRSAKSMASDTIGTVTSSISKISDMVNNGIDAQPTIRPVMDLTDVEAGASRIGGLLNTSSSLGVVANANSVSSMMLGYRQNRGNDDIVSEISKLRRDVGSMNNTTYQINGITYDDGSNVQSAVETLVRAARVGRRM